MNGKLRMEYQFDDDAPLVSVTISPESTLDEVFDAFETFLIACEYPVERGSLCVHKEYNPQDPLNILTDENPELN